MYPLAPGSMLASVYLHPVSQVTHSGAASVSILSLYSCLSPASAPVLVK